MHWSSARDSGIITKCHLAIYVAEKNKSSIALKSFLLCSWVVLSTLTCYVWRILAKSLMFSFPLTCKVTSVSGMALTPLSHNSFPAVFHFWTTEQTKRGTIYSLHWNEDFEARVMASQIKMKFLLLVLFSLDRSSCSESDPEAIINLGRSAENCIFYDSIALGLWRA